MAGCKFSSQILNGCVQSVGGVKRDIYLANLEDIQGFDLTTIPGYLSAFTFASNTGFYKFQTLNNGASTNFAPAEVEGGSRMFSHGFGMRLFLNDPNDMLTVEQLLLSQVVAVVADNNLRIRVYGLRNGLQMNAEGGETLEGALTTDSSAQFTFSGAEKGVPQLVLSTDAGTADENYSDTILYLESLLVPAGS